MTAAIIVSAILAAVAAVASGVSAYSATKKTNEQNQVNYEDWKSYNDPANQMQRLTDAGLNPYMVNGVSNTLSAPFNVQNNTGISSLFSQLSGAASQGVAGFNAAESNAIKRSNLELTKEGLDIRRQMADIARKKGDAYAALLWSQGTIADLNAQYWRDIADERVRKFKNEAAITDLMANKMYPLKLDFYSQYYPELVANKAAQTSYTKARESDIYWSQWFRKYSFEKNLEQMILDRALRTRLGILNNDLGWANLENTSQLGSGRLGLQRDYYNLAHAKWLSGLGIEALKFPFINK